jgi:CHAD domain-containing protein
VKEYLGALTAIQDRLGSLNDGAMVKHRLAEIQKQAKSLDPAPLGRATGIITGWNAARVAADLKRLPDAWDGLAALKPFWK